MKKYIAEMAGTFALVFCGTGAIIVNSLYGNCITHMGIAFTFGLIVFLMISLIGWISGCHINPAVTLAFYMARKISLLDALIYITVQIIGATIASLILWYLFPGAKSIGESVPAVSYNKALVLEAMATFFIMITIVLSFKEIIQENVVPIFIGAIVFIECLVMGPLTGASMNPARSIGPAIISQNYDGLSIYILGPIVGALLAVLVGFAIKPVPKHEA